MQEKLLKKIVQVFAGPGSEKLVDLLHKKQNVNEFLIAKKLNMTINQTRNILYKLADEGLVSFIRKKDKKKGGWYTYFWTLKVKKGLTRFKENVERDLEKLEAQLESLKNERRYYCKNCDLEYSEEHAMLHDFTCEECGEVLEAKETEGVGENIEGEIKKVKIVLEQIQQEIDVVEAKEQKAQERKLKAKQKQKELERLERKKQREREKKKLERAAKKGKKKKKTKKKKAKKKVKKKPKKKVKKKTKKKKLKKKAKKTKKKVSKKRRR